MYEIRQIEFGSDRYHASKAFREKLLRTPLGLVWSEKDLAGENEQIHIAALTDDDRVVGTVLLKPIDQRIAKLRQMAVSDKMQGTGVGRALVHFLEAVAKERHFERIEMIARVSAQGFYERLGYHTEGDVFVELTVPAIVMAKTI